MERAKRKYISKYVEKNVHDRYFVKGKDKFKAWVLPSRHLFGLWARKNNSMTDLFYYNRYHKDEKGLWHLIAESYNLIVADYDSRKLTRRDYYICQCGAPLRVENSEKLPRGKLPFKPTLNMKCVADERIKESDVCVKCYSKWYVDEQRKITRRKAMANMKRMTIARMRRREQEEEE